MSKCSSCYGEIKDKEVAVCETCEGLIHVSCAIIEGGVFCDTCYTEGLNKGSSLAFEIPDVIRRSYIKEYDDCPYKFYSHQILGIEQDMNIYAQLGIDLHELFEKRSKDTNYPMSDMIAKYNEIFRNYPEDIFNDLYGNTTKDDMYERGLRSIEGFYDVIDDLEGELYSVEKTYEFSVGEDLPKVQATIDRVNMVDGELDIMDWKTGNVMVGKALSSDLQPPLYIAAVQKEYGLTVRSFTLHYLSEGKKRVYERINDDNYVCRVGKREYKINITDSIRKVQHIFSQIKKGNFNIPINTDGMYYNCKVCHIKKKGKCEGADIQVWNQFNR